MRTSLPPIARLASPRWLTLGAAWAAMLVWSPNAAGAILPTADGYYGIWYAVGASGDQYAYKYSGGLGTYMQQTSPLAIYSAEVDRTYFVYGGTNGTNNVLKNYISYFDHGTGLLARPREVRHVGGSDNHRNVTFTIDDDGYLHVFGNSHGDGGTGNYYKSSQPFGISEFDEVALPGSVFNNGATTPKVVLSYSNAYYVPGNGLMLVYNQHHDGRAAHVATSADGVSWTDQTLFDTNQGHYTLARQHGSTIGISADYHRSGSLDNRTNLYYFQTTDFGQTWTNAAGAALATPLTTRDNAALVHDYFAENRLVYMKDIDYDAAGNPILLYLTVSDETGSGHRSGPQPGGRTLHTAHWTDSQWQIRDVMMTDHNYDHGELYVESDGTWRIIGPYLDGPQAYGTGGEVGVWTSQNQGDSWQMVDQLTSGSQFNHTYVRQPAHAHEDFYAYWADGNAFAQSASRFYFATKSGDVYQMPTQFAGDFAAPILVTPNDPDPEPARGAYEGFDYSTALPLPGLSGGSGWAGPWQLSGVGQEGEFTALQEGGSLSSPAYPVATTGGRARVAGPGTGGSNNVRIDRQLATPFDMGQDGVLYASFLFQKDVSVPGSNNNIELDLISDAGGAVVRVGSTSNDQWFVNVAADAFGSVTLGQTYVLVLKVEASAASDDIRSVLIFDPSQTVPDSQPATWDFSNSVSSSAVIDGVRLWIGRLAEGQLDEIRIGPTWASVTVDDVTGPLPGDFNGDGNVDAADLAIWSANFGQPTGATASAGDANGDGAVDGADFLVWQRGLTAPASSSAVPEPTAWRLVAGAAPFAWRGKRRLQRATRCPEINCVFSPFVVWGKRQ